MTEVARRWVSAEPPREGSADEASTPTSCEDPTGESSASALERPATLERATTFEPAALERPATFEPPAALERPAVLELPSSPTWAGELLSDEGDARALARRAGVGLVLACAYGLALGAREGGASLVVHALGVPAALVAVALVGLPSLCIVLALFGAPLSLGRASLAATRGLASAGLVLAGLAPLAAFYVVTSESPTAAALAASLGLVVGGALGLRHLVLTLRDALEEAGPAVRAWATLCQIGFGVFAVLLGWRVWGAMLPLVGGA